MLFATFMALCFCLCVQTFRVGNTQHQRYEQAQVHRNPSLLHRFLQVLNKFKFVSTWSQHSLSMWQCINIDKACNISTDVVQVFGMPQSATYQQQQTPINWQTTQPVFPTLGGRGQSHCNTCIGTPIASQNAYHNQSSYPSQPREPNFAGTSSNPGLLQQFHNLPQGASFGSQPGYMHEKEYYNSQSMHGAPHESLQPRQGRQHMPPESAEGQNGPGGVLTMGPGGCEGLREHPAARDGNGGRGDFSTDLGREPARRTPSTQRGRAIHTSSSTRISPGGGTNRDLAETRKEHLPVLHTHNSPRVLSSNSSKSSPLYTLSQRKQHRVEGQSYLKEVKRSIAEGRVPQVRLEQSNTGEIIQYKAQFLNALKLAALSLVPNADIDVKNQSTMQEIMKEVKRQFIIEKPLPEGMVTGYLQRLYKRNRAMYHRHWTLHGDQSKPDDCPSAAWLQLVDYWKSGEGSNECERNKANASAKKSTSTIVRYHVLNSLFDRQIAICCIFHMGRGRGSEVQATSLTKPEKPI